MRGALENELVGKAGGEQSSTVRPAGVFECIFRRKSAILHHLDAPLLKERDAYLQYQLQRGRRPKTLADTSELLLHVIRVMKIEEPRAVRMAEIRQASESWVQENLKHRLNRPNKTSARRFVSVARAWFRFQGLFLKASPAVSRFDCTLSEFNRALTCEMNYLPNTAKSISRSLGRFLAWTTQGKSSLDSISLQDIDSYLDEGRALGWQPRTLVMYCQALRIFFKFAESRNLCKKGFAQTIRNPRARRIDREVTGPSWKEVRKLINSVSGTGPSDCRAKAILLLASVYGLRNTEITGLRLDDLNWQDEILSFKRVKRGRFQQFPIRYEVGLAIIRYLRTARPQCTCRNLFVTMLPPHRALVNLAPIVRKLMNRAGIISETYGTHGLRHACATELLRRGMPLRDIADFLGHRDLRSVGIYAKHDTRSMREVAKFKLGTLL